jgi:hypothetical protein
VGFWVFIPNIAEAVSIRQQWQFSPAGASHESNPQDEVLKMRRFTREPDESQQKRRAGGRARL